MYYVTIRQFARTLRNLDGVLAKAQAYATTRKFNVDNFCGARLAPDMLPFTAQIRIACDQAKNAAANLSGKEAPRHEDNETTFEQLRERITKCLAYLDSFQPADFAATAPDKLIPMANPKGKALRADDYLLTRQIPNFFFHVSTAYGILRHGGVEIGKSDYLGQLDLKDL